MSETATTTRQPVLYLSHGAPPLADDPVWTDQLATGRAGSTSRRTSSMVSAHWEEAPLSLSATTGDVPLVYDFYGFPRHYYEVTYAAPGAPELAADVAKLVHSSDTPGPPRRDPRPRPRRLRAARGDVSRGRHPRAADVDADPRPAGAVRPRPQARAAARPGHADRRVGLHHAQPALVQPGRRPRRHAPAASAEFDNWAAEALERQDVDAILDFMHKAPAAREAHPRTEHWAPLYVSLGAAYESGSLDNQSVIDGFWFGLSKRSWQFA